MRNGRKERICPRCGLPYSCLEQREREGNTYVYAVHAHREGGRVLIRRCYLGPASSYKYVSMLHENEGLQLRGLLDERRAISYLSSLVDYIRTSFKIEDGDSREEISEKLRKIAYSLIEIADEISGGENGGSQGRFHKSVETRLHIKKSL